MPAIQTAIGPLTVQATTGTTGYTLVNGTGTVLTWTAPNDGQLHYALAAASLSVSSGQTGGLINFTAVIPGGGVPADALFNGGQAAGNYMSFGPMTCVAPGQVVHVVQASALTLGAAVLYAAILGI